MSLLAKVTRINTVTPPVLPTQAIGTDSDAAALDVCRIWKFSWECGYWLRVGKREGRVERWVRLYRKDVNS